MTRPPSVFLSAGEASGDRLGAGLARALRERRPDLRVFGMGGERMAAAGVERVQDSSEVAVNGLFEVLAHLPRLRRVMGLLERTIRDERPDLVVPIDFPDFNLRLSARCRRAGIPVVYFVSPQIWAWRSGRIRNIRKLVRRMLVLFPFELGFYESAGVPATFVGHPLGGWSDSGVGAGEWRSRLGLKPGGRVVALMPGSRPGEVARILPILLESADRLRRTHPDLQFVLSLTPELGEGWLHEAVPAVRDAAIAIHSGDFPGFLEGCDAGVVAAGTASLESALTGLPLVVVYRVTPLTHAVGKRMLRVPDVGLANLVAGRRIVPELIQHDCTPERIAAEVARYLDDPDHAASVRRELVGLRERLGGGDIYDRAAEAVLAELAPPA